LVIVLSEYDPGQMDISLTSARKTKVTNLLVIKTSSVSSFQAGHWEWWRREVISQSRH